MLAWIYQVASRENPALEPSFLIGGVAENFGTSFQLRPTRTFIIEGDEYDTAFFDKGPKFLHYFPDALILTHVEFDHADIYADLEAVKVAFKRLVNLVPRRGRIVAYDGSANVTECVASAFCTVERYGFTPEADWQLRNLRHEDGLTRWQVWHSGALWSEAGNASRRRAQRAQRHRRSRTRFRSEASTRKQSRRRSPHFKSVKRRLEVRAEIAGITIIDDFAHHPTAIRETLRALALRLSAVASVGRPRAALQHACGARSSKRTSLKVCASPTVSSSPASISSSAFPTPSACIPKMWSGPSTATGTPAELHPDVEGIIEAIAPQLHSGDVVAMLSNGGFDGIYEKLPARLEELHLQRREPHDRVSCSAHHDSGARHPLVRSSSFPWAMITGNVVPLYNVAQLHRPLRLPDRGHSH